MVDLLKSVLISKVPVLLELKAQTGDGQELMAGRSVEDLIDEYVAAGAAGISVVTGKWFGGSRNMLRAASEHTKLPLLHKDFLCRPSQLERSSRDGASAVLLTVGLVEDRTLRSLVRVSLDLGLTPFVEVSTADHVVRIPQPEDCIIAVNNKDIFSKEIGPADLSRSYQLLAAIKQTGCRCIIAAGGIVNGAAGASLLNFGFSGLLVGTAVLRDTSPAEFCGDLVRNRVV